MTDSVTQEAAGGKPTAPTDWRELCEELYRAFTAHARTDKQNDLLDRLQLALAQSEGTITADAAFAMGQAGGSPSEAERLAFEAWMKGHSWLVAGTWNGVTYDDRGGNRYSSVDHDAMQTRMLWAAWRDRAALAQPEPEVVGPTDEEIEEWSDASADVPLEALDPDIGGWQRCFNSKEFCQMVRAVLARFGGRPAPAPAAPGEVKEVAAWLRAYCDEEFGPLSIDPDVSWLTRAADLLERQAAPVPVPVRERLPEPEDCDAEGRCWVHQPHEACPESPAWELMLAKYASANYEALCWLPAYALPLPSGEVAR